MKKGDLRKQEILRTAEQLFCRKGYEETSIQDILDVLHSSKGSFYHHYASKESLLEAMCGSRAVIMSGQAAEKLAGEADTLKKLNIVFSGMLPLSGERLSFLLMLLPVFGLPEGWSLKNAYRQSLENAFGGMARETVAEGCEKEIFYCRNAEKTAGICMSLINDVWCDICGTILENEREGKQTDIQELLGILDTYRAALERILSAPYGSIELMRLPDLAFIAEQIHVHWRHSA